MFWDNHRQWLGISFGIASPLICALFKLALRPYVHTDESPYLFFFVATFLSSWFFGLRSGLTAVTTSVLSSFYLFSPEQEAVRAAPTMTGFLVRSIAFVAQAVFISYATAALRRSSVIAATAKANDRFRTLLDGHPDALLTVDKKGTILHINPQGERMFGYAASELEGKNLGCLIPERFRNIHKEHVSRFFAHPTTRPMGHKSAGHLLGLKRNGVEFPVDIALSAVDIEGQRIALASVRDDTARVQAEAKIRQMNVELEQRVSERTRQIKEQAEDTQFIMDNLHVLVWRTDASGQITYVNREWERYTGIALPDLLESNGAIVQHPGEVPETHARWRKSIETNQPFSHEMRFKAANGQYYWFLSRATPAFDREGSVKYWIGSSVNIDQQKTASERLRRILDNIGVYIGVYTPDGLIIEANRRLLDDSGLTYADVLGKHAADMPWWQASTETRQLLQRTLENSRNGAATTSETVWRIKERNVPVAFSCNPIIEHGRVVQLVNSAVDLTRIRNLEQQLAHSAKLEAVGRLAGGIAHDFNNLLTVIMGYAQIMMETDKLSEDQMDRLRAIVEVSERAQGMTGQLLSFSRSAPVQTEILDVNEITQGMQKMAQHLVGSHIPIECNPDPNLWPVKAAAELLQNALINLIVNAKDAGATKLWIKTENHTVDSEFSEKHLDLRPGDYVRLTITDNGSGIAKENIDKIFEPFFSTKEKGKGTGLGLSVTYGAIRQAGGAIWVYSEIGRGTTFRIYLPRSTEEITTLTAAPAPASLRENSKYTVVLVEDEAPVRRVIYDMLNIKGYEILEIVDPVRVKEVLEVCNCEPDILLTDIVMPGINGLDVAKTVKKMFPKIKIIYMSGYSDIAGDQLSQIPRSEGMFLDKPLTPRKLLTAINAALANGSKQ